MCIRDSATTATIITTANITATAMTAATSAQATGTPTGLHSPCFGRWRRIGLPGFHRPLARGLRRLLWEATPDSIEALRSCRIHEREGDGT
eukprot:5658849-Pyramimonas_sp.AAC.1